MESRSFTTGGTSSDYKDLPETPKKVATTTRTVAADAAHLARVLRVAAYPPV